jgi:hypothetical protein
VIGDAVIGVAVVVVVVVVIIIIIVIAVISCMYGHIKCFQLIQHGIG